MRDGLSPSLLLSLDWSVSLIVLVVTGTIGAIAAIYALYEWWTRRDDRRMARLHRYATA